MSESPRRVIAHAPSWPIHGPGVSAMCGLTGILSGRIGRRRISAHPYRHERCAPHRGPDAEGTWIDREAGSLLAIGGFRSSICRPRARNPCTRPTERWVTVYNGELYNTEDIRSRDRACRRGRDWRGHSDTEVILEAVSVWGVQRPSKNSTASSRSHSGTAVSNVSGSLAIGWA